MAVRVAKAGSDEAPKKLLADTRIEETISESSVKLSSRALRMNFGGTQYTVDYEVRAPIGIALTLSATNGEIDVTDWEGRVEMSATNGSSRNGSQGRSGCQHDERKNRHQLAQLTNGA